MDEEKFQRGKLNPKDDESIMTLIKDIREIEPKYITQYLEDKSIIGSEDKQAIEHLPTRKERVEEMVGIIRNRGPNAFDGFCSALIKGRYVDLASKLKDIARGGARPRVSNTVVPQRVRRISSPSSNTPPRITRSDARNRKKSDPISTQAPSKVGRDFKTSIRPSSAHKKVAVVKPSPKSVPYDSKRSPSEDTGSEQKKSLDESEQTMPKAAVQITHNEEKTSRTSSAGSSSGQELSGRSNPVSTASVEIHQSLNSAHDRATNHVETMLPMLDLLSSDDEELSRSVTKEKLTEHLSLVEREKSAVEKSSSLSDEKYNRDMLLMVLRMNEMLLFMMGVLKKLVTSLKGKGSDYESKIKSMTIEIDTLQKELKEKKEELVEANRDYMVESNILQNDLKSAVKALAKATSDLYREGNSKDENKSGDGAIEPVRGETDFLHGSSDDCDTDSAFVPYFSSETVYLRSDNESNTDRNQKPSCRGRRDAKNRGRKQ